MPVSANGDEAQFYAFLRRTLREHPAVCRTAILQPEDIGHTGDKGSLFPLNSQTFHHISSINHIIMLFIPENWWNDHYAVISQYDFAKRQ